MLLTLSIIAPSQLASACTDTSKFAALKDTTVGSAKKTGVKPKPKMSFNELMRAGGANSKRIVRVVKGTGPKDDQNPYNNPFMRKKPVVGTNGTGKEEATKPVKKTAVAKKVLVEKKAAADKRTSKKRGSDDEYDIAPAPIAKKRKLVSRKDMNMRRG